MHNQALSAGPVNNVRWLLLCDPDCTVVNDQKKQSAECGHTGVCYDQDPHDTPTYKEVVDRLAQCVNYLECEGGEMWYSSGTEYDMVPEEKRQEILSVLDRAQKKKEPERYDLD